MLPGSPRHDVHPWARSSRWIVLLLVLSTVTWRAQQLYGGGADVVVLAKAALAGLALLLAWGARVSAPRGRRMGTALLWLVVAYVAVSTFGAWTAGGLAVSGVLSVRVLLLMAVVVLLVKTFPAERLVHDLMAVLALVAVVASVTGVPGLLAGGRLRGGIPDLHSNELSLLCAVPLIGLLHLVLQGQARPHHLMLLLGLGGALVATESRTAMLVVALAFLVLLVQARRPGPVLVCLVVACVPVLLYVLFGTSLWLDFLNRDGEGDVTTLNSRSIVWAAALSYPDSGWTAWMGSGLAVKRIPVTGQYWADQNLDSSWVSALVQAGYLGVGLLFVLVVAAAVMTRRLPAGHRALAQALLAFLVARSILESGLLDSSVTFLVFLTVVLLVDRGPAQPRLPRREPLQAPVAAGRS